MNELKGATMADVVILEEDDGQLAVYTEAMIASGAWRQARAPLQLDNSFWSEIEDDYCDRFV